MRITATAFSDEHKQKIAACLLRIGACPLFLSSPRQFRFLKYMVEHSCAGALQLLKGYCIALEVFERPEDFDPANDAIVRVEAGKIRAKLREYYEEHGQHDGVQFILPKGGYYVEFCFKAAHLKAPGETPEIRHSETALHKAGLSSLSIEQVRNHLPLPHPELMARRKADAGAKSAGALHKSKKLHSLAVLPFTNLSADPNQNNYLVDGLVDNLIFLMSRLSGALIISRQSSFLYRDSSARPQQIARELGVNYLVEGTAQQVLTEMRITVRLVDAATGAYVWSERYTGSMEDVFSMQDNIALNIAKALKIKLSGADAELFGQSDTQNFAAHDAMLRGLQCQWKYTPGSIAEARFYFNHAVQYDPGYACAHACAHAWLARAMILQSVLQWDENPGLLDEALHLAEQAASLKPTLAYAFAILGWVHLWLKNREAALRYGRKAVAMDDHNPELLNFLSIILSSAGMGEEALAYSEQALGLNPRSSPFYQYTLGQAYYALADYQKAIDAYRLGCDLSSNFIPNHLSLCRIYAELGDMQNLKIVRAQVMEKMRHDKSRIIQHPWLCSKLAEKSRDMQVLAGLVPQQDETVLKQNVHN